MSCPRSITFTIPGKNGVGIQVTAVENNGSLDFTVEVLGSPKGSADLRGLFFHFDQSALPGLSITGGGGSITGQQIKANGVIDLGQGNNMHGAASPFDIGIAFGTPGKGNDFVNGPIKFTLDGQQDLTLDDIANVPFGARTTSTGDKMTFLSPAAPDARDDSYVVFEDGQAGLASPSHTPVGTVFQVLANDTDADGETLTVTQVQGVQHGTVQVVDGNDADLLAGDAILYTPTADYAGPDSFTYCITDGNGGTDSAAVNVGVTAVADIPGLTYEILKGATVNQIRLIVTATQTDADSSEFIDRIELSGLPPGVVVSEALVNPGAELDEIVHEFVLTLPPDENTDFDLTIAAVSKETSNSDEQVATAQKRIAYTHATTTTAVEFAAQDQSIWGSGEQFTFTDDRFVGIDTGSFDERVGTELYAGIKGNIKLGFQSTLTFEGGEIDATSDYDVTVETRFNKTTDQLLIETGAVLTDAAFTTEGPQGSYMLDFVYDVFLQAYAGLNIDFDVIDFDPLGIIPGDQTVDLGSVSEELDLPAIDVGPGTVNVLDLNSDSPSGTVLFGGTGSNQEYSATFDWPNITTGGASTTSPVVSSGASNNFLELALDVDQMLSNRLNPTTTGIYNIFDPPPETFDFPGGQFSASAEYLEVDVIGGLNFLQEFAMTLGDLSGVLRFEDGSSQQFRIGDSLLIDDASVKDANGDNDGLVEYYFEVAPTATLQNETDLGFNIGAEMELYKTSLRADLEGEAFDINLSLGPLLDLGESAPVADINVYDDTFALNFASEQVFSFV